MNDRELLAATAAGDDTAFELLVRRHTDRVWRLAWSLLRDSDAAHEAVQDTWLKAYRAAATFRGDAQVTTWLHSICHRTCLDRLRRNTLQVVPLRDTDAPVDVGPDTEVGALIVDAVDALPPDERIAFLLVDHQGYRCDEAAGIVEVPASTFRSRLSRARTKLAASLEADGVTA